MRRKDLTYYWNTIKLRYEAWHFHQVQGLKEYQELIQKKQLEYKENNDIRITQLGSQSSFYFTYAHISEYLENQTPDSLFASHYRWENELPVSLNSQNEFNPLLPFYYGLLWWNYSLKTKEDQTSKFQHIADFMLENATRHEDEVTFIYDYPYPVFKLEKNWISGITQSLAVSFFTRVYQLTKQEKYKQAAIQAFKVLIKPTFENGLLSVTKSGLEWVEEFVTTPPSHVLNGHVFAIIAAHELYLLTQDENYLFHGKAWMNSFVHHLPEYQCKHYLLHNKYQAKLSNLEYQGLYVSQFLHLTKITESKLMAEFFMYYYEHCPWNRLYFFYGLSTKRDHQSIHQFYREMRRCLGDTK